MLARAGLPIFASAEPDFDAALAMIDASSPPSDPLTETWWHWVRGLALAGAGRAEAEEELLTALRIADRIGVMPTVASSITVLALVRARDGRLEDAALLHAYASTFSLPAYSNSGLGWVERMTQDALARLDEGERARLEQAGRTLTRRDVFAILEK